MKFAIRHNDGCKEVAFYLTQDRKPVSGELIDMTGITLLDGTTPIASTVMSCGSCGNVLLHLNLHNIEEMP
jgi:hypothetical protein